MEETKKGSEATLRRLKLRQRKRALKNAHKEIVDKIAGSNLWNKAEGENEENQDDVEKASSWGMNEDNQDVEKASSWGMNKDNPDDVEKASSWGMNEDNQDDVEKASSWGMVNTDKGVETT
ncbi:hypothetical protein Leryth_021471, partial [Lithospermum erythrorhizon]